MSILLLLLSLFSLLLLLLSADAENQDPSAENPELNNSPLEAWSGSEYSHACFAYCQGFLVF